VLFPKWALKTKHFALLHEELTKYLQDRLLCVGKHDFSAVRETQVGMTGLVPATTAAATAAAATTTVAAAATAAATTTVTATSPAAATARPLLTRTSFVDLQGSAVVVLVIECVYRGISIGIVFHFHKSESLAATRFTIHDHVGAADGPKLGKEGFEIRVRHAITQISTIKLLTHQKTPRNRKLGPTNIISGPQEQARTGA
jgi:hypothetical protein